MVEQYQITGAAAAEIVASVETGVRTGRLAPGAGLPSIRRLAADLGVAPATVADAYRTLRQRGVVETAGRHGTHVRHRPPVASREPVTVPAGILDLSNGEPIPELLPTLETALGRVRSAPGGYTTAGPYPRLVEVARTRLAQDGVSGDMTVTGGALDGIDRTLAAHLRPGDAIGVEDPTWPNLLDLVAAHGLRVVPIPVDDQGPTVAGLRAAVTARAAAVILTCRAQNPTGAAITAERSQLLREVLAAAPDTLVIEDDHWGELAEHPLHPVIGTTRHWVFLRSVSKPYGPDLRLAMVAGDATTIARLEGRMRIGSGWVSTILQQITVALMEDPDAQAVIREASDHYGRKRRDLISALADRNVAATGVSGLNVWIPVPDETAAVTAVRDRGYAVAAGAHFRINTPSAIRVTIAALPDDRVADLAAAIAAVPSAAPAV